MKRIIRDRPLTPEEAAEYRAVREEIAREKPDLEARIRARMAAQQESAVSGAATLGQRIRAAREARSESPADLAAAADISQEYLSQLEQDEHEPTLSVAARLAQALDMSLDELAAGVS